MTFTCPICGLVSDVVQAVEQGYCEKCGEFTGALRTKSGKLVTREMVERLAEEAERGYDPKTLKPRRL